MPRLWSWTKELVGISPELNPEERAVLASHELIPKTSAT
jgi:hypothetical protein